VTTWPDPDEAEGADPLDELEPDDPLDDEPEPGDELSDEGVPSDGEAPAPPEDEVRDDVVDVVADVGDDPWRLVSWAASPTSPAVAAAAVAATHVVAWRSPCRARRRPSAERVASGLGACRG
jgi:hypothetical protein